MKKSTIISILIFLSIASVAQTERDIQAWQKGELEFNFSKMYGLSFQDEIRLTNNAGKLSYYYLDAGNVFSFTKNLRLALDYIFVGKEQEEKNAWSYRHQYNVSITYRKKLPAKLTLYNRLLNEGQWVDLNISGANHQLQDKYLRDKATLKCKVNRHLTPYLSDEIYYRLMRQGKKNPVGFNRNRLYTGILYYLSKDFKLDFFLLYENNFKQSTNPKNYICGIGFSRSVF